MTYAPERLLEVRRFMRPITGLPDSALGITPDEEHNGGYHCGWDDRRIVDGRLSDYAWTESTRDSSHRTNAARAFDLGMFPRLREFSVWLVAECARGAPDCADIREVIYSPEGRTVKRWDRLGRRTSGDSSHLTHTHISYFADAEDRDKTGPYRRFFDMDQHDTLIADTGHPARRVGDAIGDQQNLRNWEIGEAPSPAGPGDTALVYPRPGSPAWNLAHLPELLAEHGGGMTDAQVDRLAGLIVTGLTPVIQALPKPPTAQEIAVAVADEDHRRSAG